MWTARFSCIAHSSDHCTLSDALATGDPHCAQMSISGLPAISVVQNDQVPIPEFTPAGEYNYTAVSGVNRIAFRASNIQARMDVRVEIISGKIGQHGRPYESAYADSPLVYLSTEAGAIELRCRWV